MYFKKWIPIVCMTILLALAGLLVFSLSSAELEQRELSEKIIRFHVIAQSDSEKDQSLKLSVRNAVLSELGQWTKDCRNRAETRALLQSRLSDIQSIAEDALRKEGSSAPVTVSLEQCDFPVKTYGDLTFPAGTYEALQIRLGEAAGRNWWCVLYPPLCFLDASSAQMTGESRTLLEETLSAHTYQSLYGKEASGLTYGKQLAKELLNGTLPVKWKLAEWLSSLFSPRP